MTFVHAAPAAFVALALLSSTAPTAARAPRRAAIGGEPGRPAVAQQAVPQQAAPQQGQAQEQQQPPTFRAGVRVVRVDVTVTGKGDQPVVGLQPEDFEVTEDGTPVKVEGLQFIRLDGSMPAGDDRSLTIRSTEHAQQEAARDDVRVFAVFLDDYHVLKVPAVTLPARKALTDFVNRLWPTDMVALMEPLTPLSALKFTRSRAELLTAINGFQGRYGELFPVKSPLEEAQWQRGDVARIRAEVTLSALAALTVRLGSLKEGRKTIIFISQGPPTYFGTRSPGLQDRMQEIAQAASRGNVTIYPLDPAGLGMTEGVGSRDTLYQLASETGGRAMVNMNDPTRSLDRIFSDASAYYVLGYTPPRPQDDGRYHKISVKVKRSGTRVLARQGYWSPDPREVEAAREAAARTPEPGVAKALETAATLEPTKRPVDLWLGWSKAEGNQSQLRVTWDPPEQVSGALLGAKAVEIEVLDAARAKPLLPMQSIGAATTTSSAASRAGATFVLAPGAAGLKVTVRGEGGEVLDSWTQPLTVPDFGRVPVALSSIRFYRARTAADLRTLRAAADPMPLASRRFSRSDRVLVAVDTYAGPGTTATLESHVLARDGRELAPLPLPEPEGITTRFELPLSSLGQGTYLLRIRARTAAGYNEQVVAFRVGN